MATGKTAIVKRKVNGKSFFESDRFKDMKYAQKTQRPSHGPGGYDLKKARKNRLAAEKRAAMKAKKNKSSGGSGG